ncbi:hypothetical protein [Paludibaculum fermentans]|uniref:Uncharacterized protein n=1 Tax=Paludibaculum fermentans TaxID=1473598 RepID=A0A7S7SNQ0_PALFE|nr:hypothetical protein [Paludibaculum fermentans]QOY91704.1 hypothetical protein IRI77_17700 [Paludibaculum fermentans]
MGTGRWLDGVEAAPLEFVDEFGGDGLGEPAFDWCLGVELDADGGEESVEVRAVLGRDSDGVGAVRRLKPPMGGLG